MVRINMDLPENLHRRVKSEASLQGLKLKEYIIKTIEEKLDGNI